MSLQKLFDIANGNVMTLISDEQKEFLINQRKDERIGYIANIRPKNDVEDELQSSFSQTSLSSAEKQNESPEYFPSQKTVQSSSSGDLYEPGPSQPKRKFVNIIDEDVVAALDRCSITDRQAAHVITAVCNSLKENQFLSANLNDFSISRSTIRRQRLLLRESKWEQIRKEFGVSKSTSYVVHWDGKILPNLQNVGNVDRVPIVVTFEGKEQLLGVPELDSGTGLNQATAINETVSDWGLSESVKAVCCDTAATNLGRLNGAAVHLERLLERDLLYLPCRHHILELVLRSAFETVFPVTRGPNVTIFQRFQSTWPQVNKSNYKSGMEDETVFEMLHNKVQIIKQSVTNLLKQNFPRDDYREFLELVLVFLGNAPINYEFRKPGAVSHARWMAKAIYTLKIFIFRTEFQLKKAEERGLRDVCLFLTIVYVEAWYFAPVTQKAPNQDLKLLKNIDTFKSINQQIAKNAIGKFTNHLWYLSPETSVLALFDEDVSLDVKLKMVENLKISQETYDELLTATDEDCDYDGEPTHTKRYETQNVRELLNKEIDFFVNTESLNFFKRFNLETNFLEKHPSEWQNDSEYLTALNCVQNLKVVNDCAERMVKLMKDFRCKFTKDEKQLQYILQVVNDHRKKHPSTV